MSLELDRGSVLALALVLVVAFSILARASFVHATSTYFEEVLETMMSTQMVDGLSIVHIFAPQSATTLHFTSNLDPVARSFSYSLLPGQLYQGQSISLSTNGSFDSILGIYGHATSGQIGPQTWSAGGTIRWVGDPTRQVHTTVMIDGNIFHVTGSLEFEPSSGAGRSTGMFTFTGSPSGPRGADPFGPYPGTDAFLLGQWEYTVQVPPNPLVPDGVVLFSRGNVPFPNGGPGNFEVHIALVPEPSTPLPLGSSLAGLGGFAWRWQRRKQSHPAESRRSLKGQPGA